jgi:4-amino-4-deoxy-L-arabinose transferase-like glycosyltransferase
MHTGSGEETSGSASRPQGTGGHPVRGRRPGYRGGRAALLLAAVVLGILLRVPALYNSEYDFNSDEAVNALVMKHMLEGRGFSFFNWETTYYGIVEGLFAVPFVALFGYEPLAFKLSALVGFLILQVSVFLLGRRLYGVSAGIAAAAFLSVLSPMLIVWSTMASGGYCLIVGWGTITALYALRLARRPTVARAAIFGWLLGFGLYIYQLYVVYVATFAAALVFAAACQLALPGGRARAGRLLEAFGIRRAVKFLLACAGGFALGWAPTIIAHLWGLAAIKQPSYRLAAPGVIGANVELLTRRCLPALFGVNPFGVPELLSWSGPSFPLWAEVCYLGLFGAAWLWGVRAALGREGREGRVVPAALVLLPVVNVLLFILSPNPQDTLSHRYLLPSLTSFAVLAGGMVVRLGGRSILRLLLLSCLVIAFGLSKSAAWLVSRNYLTGDLRLVRKHEPLDDVLDLLRREGVHGAFGDYWTAYKATFLSREEITVASVSIWDRNPEMTRAVRALPTAPYIFKASSRQDSAFQERLHDYQIPHTRYLIQTYAVYMSPAGQSLGRAELGPLPRFASSVAVEGAPQVLRPGESARVKIRVTNTSDSVWSAEGDDGGEYRVTASSRWLGAGQDPAGDAARALLPRDVRPGETFEGWVPVVAPSRPGQYALVLTLVQERVAWFCDVGGGDARLSILVKPNPD